MTYADRRTVRPSGSRFRPPAHLPACPPFLAVLTILAVPAPFVTAAAQVPDSLPRDSAAVVLEPVTVSVTRTDAALARVPLAISVLDRNDIVRGRPTLGLDEGLSGIPGVYVANRFNFSLDQRLSIRGFGSRANFGLRGVKVLLDGVPQTLPDGQSQLTNVEFASLDRIEVIRGPATALYGNASGGVISLTTGPAPDRPFGATVRAEAGSYGLDKSWLRIAGRQGSLSGRLDASRLDMKGFREHSAVRMTGVQGILRYALPSGALITVRAAHTDAPRADNPGALTAQELAADPSAAAPNNLARDAGKDVSQDQASVALKVFGPNGAETQVAVFGFRRDLHNPIATGTLIQIDRRAGGIRFTAGRALARGVESPRVVAGFDLQRMRDDRRNRLTTVPADSIQVDQREIVTEVGPFAELLWPVDRRWLLSAGARYDRITFDVEDHHLTDGSDESGSRTMAALSGSAGLSYLVSRRLTLYANAGTAFETPTTTELANQPGGSGGFNRSLGPQRAVSLEIGARGTAGRWIRFSAAAYLNRIRDAIVQFQEAGGRAYFRNAGRLNNDGFEAGVTVIPADRLAISAAYTWAHYRFADYVVVSGTAADTLDGKTLPGVPEHFVRLEARASPGAGAWILADYTVSSAVWADDTNTLKAGGWGIAGLSLTWPVRLDQWTLELTAGARNLFDRNYVSSVTVNGFNGRVFEPGAGRTWYGGVRITAGGN